MGPQAESVTARAKRRKRESFQNMEGTSQSQTRQSKLNEGRATTPRIGLYVETHVTPLYSHMTEVSRGVGWPWALTWPGGRDAQEGPRPLEPSSLFLWGLAAVRSEWPWALVMNQPQAEATLLGIGLLFLCPLYLRTQTLSWALSKDLPGHCGHKTSGRKAKA